MAIPNTKKQLLDQIEYANNAHSALTGADCAIIMTEWDEFRKLKSKDFQAHMKTPMIVDARRIFDPKEFNQLNYVAVGLGPSIP
jgi:UDPglucose 6-dehydrogenase